MRFTVCQINKDEKIKRFDFQPMHSISVGDVIRNDKYECYVVAPCGFERLGMTSTNGRQWFAEEIA